MHIKLRSDSFDRERLLYEPTIEAGLARGLDSAASQPREPSTQRETNNGSDQEQEPLAELQTPKV